MVGSDGGTRYFDVDEIGDDEVEEGAHESAILHCQQRPSLLLLEEY